MGRDISNTPFAWQSKTNTQNRFLKFLLLVIILSALSFYIGFPDSKSASPVSDKQQYSDQQKEVVNSNSSNTESKNAGSENPGSSETSADQTANEPKPDKVSDDNAGSAETIESNGIEKIPSNDTSSPIFDSAVVPSGPAQEEDEAVEEEKKVEEEHENHGNSEDAEENKSGDAVTTTTELSMEDREGNDDPKDESESGTTVSNNEETTTTENKVADEAPSKEAESIQASQDSDHVEKEGESETTTTSDESATTTEKKTNGAELVEKSETEEKNGDSSTKSPEVTSESSVDTTTIEEQLKSNNDEEKQVDGNEKESTFRVLNEDHNENEEIGEGTKKVTEETTTVETTERQNVDDTTENQTTQTTSSSYNAKEEKKSYRKCKVEEWNDVTTVEVPNQSVHKKLLLDMDSEDETENIQHKPRIISAFAYKDSIAVTLSAKNFSSETVYCRYHDCYKKGMGDPKPSFVYPESTVYCPRRAGAKYISISETLDTIGQYPVQIVKRQRPEHFLTVCVPLNDENVNILEVARFIEYYKLQGATFFNVYYKNMSKYQTMLLEDYTKTGDVKLVKVGSESTEQIEANDCQHRSKYFSKWTAFLALNDRLEVGDGAKEGTTIASKIDSVVDFKLNVLKYTSPETDEKIRIVVRPDKIVSINQHPILVYSDDQPQEAIAESSGLLKEFINSDDKWTPENLSENIEDNVPLRGELLENILSRTKLVYRTMEEDSKMDE